MGLQRFLPSLMGHHVLVRMNNTATVVYINHQGGYVPSVTHAGMQTDKELWESASIRGVDSVSGDC